MNLKLKSLAAVLAMAAAASSAHASIASPAFGGDGGLFLTVWDDTPGNEATFIFSLGTTLSAFQSTGSYHFDSLFSNATFQQYFGAGSAGGTNFGEQGAWKWNVVAGSNLADQSQILTTAGASTLNLVNGAVDSAATRLQTYQSNFGSANVLGTDVKANPLYAGDNFGNNFNGGAPLNNAGVVGGSLNFFHATNNVAPDFDNSSLDPATIVKDAFTWNLDSSGNLTYNYTANAVPVPAAIWLLGSGLMGLLGVGRRRVAAQAV